MLSVKIGLTILSINFCTTIASPYDDGKYNPKKYKIYDDGRYYRPLTEGRYIPSDEGRYTYIYRQGLYPGDDGEYGYVHQEGPRGPDGSPGYPGGYYLGHKIYAEKYKHMKLGHWAHEIVNKYIHNNNGYDAEQSRYYFDKINVDDDFGNNVNQINCSNVWDGLHPQGTWDENFQLVKMYNLQGEKKIDLITSDRSKNLRYVYHVFVKVYEEKK